MVGPKRVGCRGQVCGSIRMMEKNDIGGGGKYVFYDISVSFGLLYYPIWGCGCWSHRREWMLCEGWCELGFWSLWNYLEFVCSRVSANSMFVFSDSVPMGSLLAPIISAVFMNFFEMEIFNSGCNLTQYIIYTTQQIGNFSEDAAMWMRYL